MNNHCAAHATATEVGRRFAQSLQVIPGVLAVGVNRVGQAFEVLTVIAEHDMDVWERVFAEEFRLYDRYPGLEADFSVVEQGRDISVYAMDYWQHIR